MLGKHRGLRERESIAALVVQDGFSSRASLSDVMIGRSRNVNQREYFSLLLLERPGSFNSIGHAHGKEMIRKLIGM